MSVFDMARVDRPACAKCQAMVPEVIVPLTDTDARPMCWYCAHAVTEHEAAPEGAESVHCGCPESAILPAYLVALRGRAVASVSAEVPPVVTPSPRERWEQKKADLVGPHPGRRGVGSKGYLTAEGRGAIPRVSGRVGRS